MNKKVVLMTGVAALVLMVGGISLASPMWGGGMMGRGPGGMGPGIQPLQLTEAQQSDWKAWQEKNFQLKKEQVQLMAKTGYLTQEQADARIKMMDSNHSFRMKNNLVGPGARLNAELTDEQKADMKKIAEQRLNLQKENLARLVAAGQITQAQADAKIQWMQERVNAGPGQGFGGPGRGGMGGGNCGGQGGGRGMGGPRF